MTFKMWFFYLTTAGVLFGYDKEWALVWLKLAGSITFVVSAITLIYFGPHQVKKIFSWHGGEKK